MTALIGAGLGPSSTAATDEERLAAVAAPVHDPLWLLARQVQTAALLAEDGGPPVTVTMTQTQAPLVRGGHPVQGQVEPRVEAEPQPAAGLLDTATRVRLASELFRLLADVGVADADVTTLRSALALAFPSTTRGETAGSAAFVGRLPDAAAMYAAWHEADGAAGLPAVPGLDAAQRAALDPAARAWVRWMGGRVGSADDVTPPTWDAVDLSYTFGATATLGGQALALAAADYDGAGVDWHSFDRLPLAATPTPGPVTTVRPTRVSYPGMPEQGFWTIEDGEVDLAALATDDPARSLLVAFAYGYTNDWFLVPLAVAPGVAMVTGLTVVDSFGTTTQVPSSATVDGVASRFRLWEVGLEGSGPGTAVGPDAGLGLRVMLPSSPPPLAGPLLEDVVLARDELANLGWLIELTTTDPDGERIDRYRRWLAARPPRTPSLADGAGTYRLGRALPDHWYPLEAGELQADGHRLLRLAALPEGAAEVSDSGVRGITVDHSPGTAVSEEVASRAGTRIRRVDRLSYTPTGYIVWRARTRDAGTGEATSGLQFDVIDQPE